MLSSMLLVLQLGVYTLRMTIEEAINACTVNAAYAIARHDRVGSLEVGKRMDLLICDVPNYASLIYQVGRQSRPPRHQGRQVRRPGGQDPALIACCSPLRDAAFCRGSLLPEFPPFLSAFKEPPLGCSLWELEAAP